MNLVVNQLTSLDLTGCSNLYSLYLGDNNISSLDLSPCSNIGTVSIQYNPSLNITAIPALSFCIFFSTINCALSSGIIDDILLALSNSGNSGGNAYFSGGTNGIPGPTGISAAAYLTGDAGWTVYYNT